MLLSSFVCVFFFKQKTAYEMRISDWSSDVCSSDLHNQTLFSSSSPTVTTRNSPTAKLNSLNLDTRKSVFVGSVDVEVVGKLLITSDEENTIPAEMLTNVINAPTALNFRHLAQPLNPKQRMGTRESTTQNNTATTLAKPEK